jgi:hypothetical protein
MDLAGIERSDDIEQFSRLDAHRTCLLDLGFGITADGDVEVGSENADLVFAETLDEDVGEDRDRRFTFDDTLE